MLSFADILSCNTIQTVSGCKPLGLHLNFWHALMKSHLACELLCTFWALFESLTCLHEIPSRLWVAVKYLGSIWIADMPLWNSIQPVNFCVLPGLYLNCWYPLMKPFPACVCFLHFIWIADLSSWKFMQRVSPHAPPWALFESVILICPDKISSRKWVFAHLLGFIWIADIWLSCFV